MLDEWFIQNIRNKDVHSISRNSHFGNLRLAPPDWFSDNPLNPIPFSSIIQIALKSDGVRTNQKEKMEISVSTSSSGRIKSPWKCCHAKPDWRWARCVFSPFGFACAAVVVVLLIRHVLLRFLGLELPPFITFYLTVLIVTMVAGLWPGLLATVLASFFTHYWILREHGHLANAGGSDAFAQAIFFATGVFVSVLG